MVTSKKLTARQVELALREFINPEKAEFFPGFMQAYPGGYGEGDKFLGVVVPDQRRIAKEFAAIELGQLSKLLSSKWHECRLTGVYILVGKFEKAHKATLKGKSTSPSDQELVDFYLNNLEGVNNWDLVDSSAHKILGPWILEHPKDIKLLRKLANSKQLWRERISVISTLAFIREKKYDEILRLAQKFLNHPHDLMHKAVGWMLREMGKRDVEVLRAFLNEHVSEMPRTMLRYSIEKLDQAERQQWLQR